jgi:hypothetical protein
MTQKRLKTRHDGGDKEDMQVHLDLSNLPQIVLETIYDYLVQPSTQFSLTASSLRLVNTTWNQIVTSKQALLCRVHLRTCYYEGDSYMRNIRRIKMNPYHYPLVANCYHDKHADYFVGIEVNQSLWNATTSIDELHHACGTLIKQATGRDANIVDFIANANQCVPLKPFVADYEGTLDIDKWSFF